MSDEPANRIEWWPAPRDGEVVPDHPPVDITPLIASGSLIFTAGPRQAVEAVMRLDEKRGIALAAGFTEARWDEQLAMVVRWARARLEAVDIPGETLRLALEFGEPTEPVQAERSRFMSRLRAAGILRDDPG